MWATVQFLWPVLHVRFLPESVHHSRHHVTSSPRPLVLSSSRFRYVLLFDHWKRCNAKLHYKISVMSRFWMKLCSLTSILALTFNFNWLLLYHLLSFSSLVQSFCLCWVLPFFLVRQPSVPKPMTGPWPLILLNCMMRLLSLLKSSILFTCPIGGAPLPRNQHLAGGLLILHILIVDPRSCWCISKSHACSTFIMSSGDTRSISW